MRSEISTANDLSSVFSENLGERSFTCPQVCDINCRDHGQEEVGQGLPGSARAIASSKFAGELVEVLAGPVFPLGNYMLEA